MDKRELKEILKNKPKEDPSSIKAYQLGYEDAISEVLDLIDQLDEPKKEELPKWVAHYMERYENIQDMLANEYFNNVYAELENDTLDSWIDKNFELFCRAWLHGWVVEKEKQYYIKKNEGLNYLYFTKIEAYSEEKINYNSEARKKWALKFDKEKAEALAILVGGEIEEVDE